MRHLVKQACTLYWNYLLDCGQNTVEKGVETAWKQAVNI